MRSRVKTDTYGRVAQIAGIYAAGIGVIALAMWALDPQTSADLRSSHILMTPTAAVLFILIGTALFLSTMFESGSQMSAVAVMVTLISLGMIVLGAIEYLIGTEMFFEEWLAGDLTTDAGFPAGRMSPNTIVLLGLICVSLLLMFGKRAMRRRRIAALIAFLTGIEGFIIFTAYLYGAPFLQSETIVAMSVSSALSAIVLCCGLISKAGAAHWPLRMFSGESTRARLLRSFLPFILLALFVEGLLDEIPNLLGVNKAVSEALLAVPILLFVILLVSRVSTTVADSLERANRDRAQAEEARRLSEEKYHHLFDHLNDAAFLADVESGIIIETNRMAERLIGKTRREIVGMHQSELLPPQRREEWKKTFMKHVRDGLVADYEGEIVNSRGEIIPVSIGTSVMTLAGRQVIVGLFRDLTERVKAERALNDSEKRYRTLVEAARDFIFIIDRDMRVTFVNEYAAQAFGGRPQDFIGKSLLDVLSSEDAERSAKNLANVFETGEAVTLENRFRFEWRKSWQSTTLVPLRNDRGEITTLLGISRDITERKRAEDALSASEEKYRSLFEESKDAIFVSTPDGRLLDMNPAGIEMLAYASIEELKNIDLAHKIYVDARQRMRYTRAIEAEGYVKDYEVQLRRSDGKHVDALITAIAVRDENGNIISYRGIIRDVTEQKNLEKQLLEAQKMEAVGLLAGGVAHDFNNLLMVIQGNAELELMNLKEGDPMFEAFTTITDASSRATSLIHQLLAFSRRQILNPEFLDVEAIVTNFTQMLNWVLGEDIVLTIQVQPGIGHIYADRTTIEQVVMNLVVNARDAMPEGGRLTITAENFEVSTGYATAQPEISPGQYVCISVIDTGIGMDDETMSRIFEPFYSRKESGTGLGLSIVYGVVRQQGGFVNVTSQPGAGTRFNVCLPMRHDVQRGAADDTKAAPDVVSSGSETILVAEDEEKVRSLLRTFLEARGYKVIEASDGNVALDIFKEKHDTIDLLVMDAVMPNLSGPRAYELMRQIDPEIACVFVTGYSDEIREEYLKKEMNATILRKPVDSHELGQTVRKVLDLARGSGDSAGKRSR